MDEGPRGWALPATYCAWKSTTTGLALLTTRSWKSPPSCTLKALGRPAEVPKALVGTASSRRSANLCAICGEKKKKKGA